MWRWVLDVTGLVGGMVAMVLLLTGYITVPDVDQDTLTVLIAAVSSLFSAVGAGAAWLTVLEMRRDREELFRPDIFAGFEVAGSGLFKFVVKNDGQSPARNIKIDVDPIPVGMGGEPIDDVRWLRKPISTLFPGQCFEKTVDVHHAVFNDDRPQEFSIRLSYESSTGTNYSEEPYTIDLRDYEKTSVPTLSPQWSLNRIARALESMAEAKPGAHQVGSGSKLPRS